MNLLWDPRGEEGPTPGLSHADGLLTPVSQTPTASAPTARPHKEETGPPLGMGYTPGRRVPRGSMTGLGAAGVGGPRRQKGAHGPLFLQREVGSAQWVGRGVGWEPGAAGETGRPETHSPANRSGV